jgi:GntR family transcriptional repressor for pyruvate dehydrogenase complex
MDWPVALVPQTTARRIHEMIRAGELREGELLPPQRELSERLDVSRASLREALSVLQTLGLLRTEPRRGTLVARTEALDGSTLHPWRFEKLYSPLEVYQFRFVTEGHATRLAAVRVSAAEIGMLMQNLRDFRDAMRERDLVAISQLDFDFHRLIMMYSGNRVFTDLYGNYGSVLSESQRLPLTRHERLWEPVSEHENVAQAIEKQDPDGACYFMHVHILRAADRVGVPLSDKV